MRESDSSTGRPKMLLIALCALLALLASACGNGDPVAEPTSAQEPTSTTTEEAPDDADGEFDALVTAAQEEGSLILYGAPSEEALQADAEAFEAEYGISVEFVRLTAGPFTPRVDQEIASGQIQADVLMTTDTLAIDRWWEEGALEALPEVDYPVTTEYYAPIQIIGQGILYNMDEIPEAELPETWADILEDRWNGRIAVGSPRIGPGYITLYYALLNDDSYGEEFFEELSGQSPRVIESPALLAQAIVSGESAIGFTAFEYLASNIKKDNPDAPIGFHYLDIATQLPTNVAITSGGPNPNAGKLFAHWIMSEDGQAVHNGDFRAASPLGEFPTTLSKVPEDQAVEIPTAEVAGESDNIIALFDRLFQ